MKKTLLALCALTLASLMCFSSCFGKKNNQQNSQAPESEAKDGFYLKTSLGTDGNATNVIDIRTEKKTYEGEGDIHVMATVGFGHLPGSVNFGTNTPDHLRVECVIIKSPFAENKRPAWENISDYSGTWADEKYNSTAKNSSNGGEFYPIFTDQIELVFPLEVEYGYFEIRLVNVFADGSSAQFETLRFYFEHKGGVLTLDP